MNLLRSQSMIAYGCGVLWASVLVAGADQSAPQPSPEVQVGQPADIASSAYQYRADRKADENAPESWLALMRYAGQPLNKPVDPAAPAIKQALCAFLWEEIRPIRKLELTWPAEAKRRPGPEDLVITTLNNQGTASSWWNNLAAVKQNVKPTVSADGATLTYDLTQDTCGLVISLAGDKLAANYDVPRVRVLTPFTWKRMDVEVEWGFDAATAGQDYSGRVECYDGVVADLRPLDNDSTTMATSATWKSTGNAATLRGVKFTLLYIGTSKWRLVYPFTSQSDDVARTIVTLWTRAGNWSFLAADLENGPILAPEHGFFVRSTQPSLAPAAKWLDEQRLQQFTFRNQMTSIAGDSNLIGWGSDETPWLGGNPGDQPVTVKEITIPAHAVAMHPGPDSDVAVGWCSPIQGQVKVEGRVAHAQAGSDGITWSIMQNTHAERRQLASGSTRGQGGQVIPAEADAAKLSAVAVDPDETIALVIGPKGTHFCDTTLVELTITEVGGSGRVWNLAADVVKTLQAGNPHADGQGHANVWRFYAEHGVAPSEPPFTLSSNAATAAEFVKELKARNQRTIRQQVRAHEEQSWDAAVIAMRGRDLPPHPQPPAGSEPPMQVQVPCERLTAQWNLGVWHLLRHCAKNPQNNDRLWFNDYPYGILAAETYLVLAALDMMGAHQPAADGFDQWTSLPLDPNSKGHHPGALPDRPVGLFSDGHGCLTHAVGPEGVGGHMDGVHAFGPGSIGWALVEHYQLTGDKAWLKANAPRIRANAEWMLRQRQVVSKMVPGGERLWCKGLQPALQVTPDSGGLWMQFYEAEAYYCTFVIRFAEALRDIDPHAGAALAAEAQAYRQDLLAAVDRSIALSPVVQVRDGTFHSAIPFGCYVRGLSTGAWGWQRDGSGSHVGPMYWETVQSAAALISPAGLLPPGDPRVQGYLDVLEDRLLLENVYVGQRDWFAAGWQYQGGLERTANMHLAADDIPVFIRSFLNCYAVDILPKDGYIFNEHAVHGPPDKIFEEAAFLERLRNLLVMEDGDALWLARATPRAWLQQGQKIVVKNAPTHFGTMGYEIISDADHGKITATIEWPARQAPKAVRLRLRHPQSVPIKSVTVNGQAWTDFDPGTEVISLHDLKGKVTVVAGYQ